MRHKYSFSFLATLVTFSQPAIAQTITPATDGVGTLIQYQGNTYNIGGGTQAGANLFHSFQEFGLNANEIANFLSNPDIQNVVGRVVGGNPSVIEGLIQLSGGDSNLFLMNPSGWVFTDGASLDVPGSFGVTTANRIGFGSSEFNGTGANDFEALIGSPTSLIFDTTQPGAILNAADLSVENGSLWMVGGSVVNTGSISTPNGAIALAAVPGESQVRLTHDSMKLSLVLDALPAEDAASNALLGLQPEELPRYLTGGSQVGNATGVELGADGQLYLVGSAMHLKQGDVVIAGEINAPEVQLMAAGQVIPTDPNLVKGDVTVVRYPEAGGTNMLSVIDSHADNAQSLLYGGTAGAIAIIINNDEDGIGAITETLARIDALLDGMSITAEGNEGNFWLGNTWVTPETIQDYQSQLAKWSVSFTDAADLLLYSCFTALGTSGETLMANLAATTGLDVAASTNATGSANHGGDWTLESRTGSIELNNPFTDATLAAWDGRLATFTVENGNDAGADSLREEIANANALAGADDIRFANGVTLVTLTSAELRITEELTISGGATNVTIQRSAAGGTPDFRIFDVRAVTTTFDNLTITGGKTNGAFGGGIQSLGDVNLTNSTVSGNSSRLAGGGVDSRVDVNLTNSIVSGNSSGSGGGISSNVGSVSLTNSTVSGNSADDFGGGIRSGSSVSLNNSTVSGNYARQLGGGIVSNGDVSLTNSDVSNNTANNSGGGIWSRGDITLIDSNVSDNSATNGGGGGIRTILAADVSLTDSTVSNNSAGDDGGGISSGRSVTLTNSTVSGNSAGGNGGGIRSILGATSLTNSTVSGNSAGESGGGIASNSGVSLTNSTVSGNTAGDDGGGIYSVQFVDLTNSTISSNSAGRDGGGISGFRGDIDLTSSTIAFNTAGSIGGGVSLKALFGTTTNTFTNSIIANNTAPTGSEVGIRRNRQNFNISNSLILSTAGMDNGSSGIPINGVNGNLVGIDPRLAPLANNGGPTQTHAFLAGSPAIDAGGTTSLTTDQRGFARLFGAGLDMGAFEFGTVDPNPMISPITLATQALAASGFDFTVIQQIWSEPVEETEALIDKFVLEQACASIPELELEFHEDDDSKPMEAQVIFDANCLPWEADFFPSNSL